MKLTELSASSLTRMIDGDSESGAVAFWNLRYEHALWDGVDFFHRQNFTRQFCGLDNLIRKTNSGFHFDIVDDLYANFSCRYDYETEPAAGASKDSAGIRGASSLHFRNSGRI
jgi:hypothetical protein